MKNGFKLLFTSPSFVNNDSKTRQIELTNAIIVTTILFLLLTLIGNLMGGKTPFLVLGLDVFALGVCVLLYYSLRKGHVKIAAVGIIAIGLTIVPAGSASLGTIRTPTTAIYMLIVVASGLLFYGRGVLIATMLSSLEIGVLIVAENMGILPAPDYSVTVTQWFTYTTLFGLTSSLTLFGVLAANRGLDRAEKEIKERERTEIELRKLTRAVEQSPASIIITDLDGNIEYANPRFTQVTGYEFNEVIGKNPRILKTQLTAPGTHKQLWDTIVTGKEWHGEFVNRKKDGSLYYELAVISAITDSNGVPTHYLAVKEDITGRKQSEEREREQRTLAEALSNSAAALNSTLKFDDVLDLIIDNVDLVVPHDSANIMLLDTDNDQVSLACHRGYVERGAKDKEMQQQFSLESLPLLAEVARTGRPLVIPDTHMDSFWTTVQATKWVRSYLTVPIQIHKRTVGFLNLDSETPGFFNHNHAERLQAFANHAAIAINNAHLYEEIHALAITDSLTNLHNRRYFDEILEKEYSRHSRSEAELSLLMMDVDHFKAFNDAYGHIHGDECLRQIAKTIEASVSRPPDVAARYGGEEFVCLLPETSLEGAKIVSEKIRQSVMGVAIPHNFSSVSKVVTISVGAATTRCLKGGSPSEIVAVADEQLYLAKSRGRNRVEAMG